MQMKKILSLGLIAICAQAVFSSPAFAGGDPAAGQKKSTTCAACHGPDGNAVIPATPSLAGQYSDYLEQALKEYRSGARQNPVMNGMSIGLSDQDIADLAAWFSSQEGLNILPKGPIK